jgi:hypothetical protein
MRRGLVPLVAAGAGSAIFALSALHGGGLSMIWLPAVMLGVAWPSSTRTLSSCLRRLRR